MEDASRQPDQVVHQECDFDRALTTAAKRIQAEYHVLVLAQTRMEPPPQPCKLRTESVKHGRACKLLS
jgi:isoquinoline 1-oxidoreductase subunit beta